MAAGSSQLASMAGAHWRAQHPAAGSGLALGHVGQVLDDPLEEQLAGGFSLAGV